MTYEEIYNKTEKEGFILLEVININFYIHEIYLIFIDKKEKQYLRYIAFTSNFNEWSKYIELWQGSEYLKDHHILSKEPDFSIKMIKSLFENEELFKSINKVML